MVVMRRKVRVLSSLCIKLKSNYNERYGTIQIRSNFKRNEDFIVPSSCSVEDPRYYYNSLI